MQTATATTIKNLLAADPEIKTDHRAAILKAVENAPKRKLISKKTACELLECCGVTLLKYERAGLIKAIRYSARKIRYDLAEIEDLRDNGIPQD